MKLWPCPLCKRTMRITENSGQRRVSHMCLGGVTITTRHYPLYKKEDLILEWNHWVNWVNRETRRS